MKKNMIALAIAAAVAAPLAAQAEPTVYGQGNLYVGKFTEKTSDELRLSDSFSAFGVKGKYDLDYGLQAVYQFEFSVTPDSAAGVNAGPGRDQWIGVGSKEFGTLRMGTISTNYKSSGSKIDPFWRTPLEGRGLIKAMSKLHSGKGDTGQGRATNTFRYDSPKIAGATVVANYTLTEGDSNGFGAGVHYGMGPIKAFVDYLNSQSLDGTAIKFGGQYSIAGFTAGVQYELLDDQLFAVSAGGNRLYVSGAYTMGNTMIGFDFGTSDKIDGKVNASTGWSVGADQKLSKMTDVYVGYASLGYDTGAGVTNKDDSGFAVGLRVKF